MALRWHDEYSNVGSIAGGDFGSGFDRPQDDQGQEEWENLQRMQWQLFGVFRFLPQQSELVEDIASIVMIGGHDCMISRYKKACQNYDCKGMDKAGKCKADVIRSHIGSKNALEEILGGVCDGYPSEQQYHAGGNLWRTAL